MSVSAVAGTRRTGGSDEAVPWVRLGCLAVLAGGLGVWAAWIVPGRLEPPKRDIGQPLLGIDPTQASEVEIRAERGRVVASIRRNTAGGWIVRAPGGPEIPADGEPVESFLTFLRGVSRLTQFVEADLAAFGLEPPRGEVLLRGTAETVLRIGDRNAPLTALYVQVLPGQDVILVGSVLLWEFDKLASWARREAEQDGDPSDP